MKGKRIKIYTIIGLVAVIAMQSIWLYSTYKQFSESIYKESGGILKKALNKEASIRFEKTPKGTMISGAPTAKSGEIVPEIAYLQEGLSNLGFQLSLEIVDSIATSLLQNIDIKDAIVLSCINMNTKEILEQSKRNIDLNSLGMIKSEIVPIRTDLSQGVQLVLVNPYYTILKRMGLLLISTAILMALVATCIIYQIKIIRKQNKIAQLREDFSQAMIHDMKNPLASIISAVSLLHGGRMDHKPELKENYFSIVESEVNHLQVLTNKVLTLAKLEKCQLDMNKIRLELEPMIDDLIEKFSIKSTKPIHFTKNLGAKVVSADEEYLKEAISNLIDNAIKYSKESVEVAISSRIDEKSIIIKVRDNGLGISDKDQKVIFEKFERASAVKRTRKGGATGFGLGLNYVYQVMQAHGGGVYVNSIEGEYSEFILYIPKIIEEL